MAHLLSRRCTSGKGGWSGLCQRWFIMSQMGASCKALEPEIARLCLQKCGFGTQVV